MTLAPSWNPYSSVNGSFCPSIDPGVRPAAQVSAHSFFLVLFVIIIIVIILLEPSEPINGLDNSLKLSICMLVRFVIFPFCEGVVNCEIKLIHGTEHRLNQVLFVQFWEAQLIAVLWRMLVNTT
jgi:uncharacterized membrane protein